MNNNPMDLSSLRNARQPQQMAPVVIPQAYPLEMVNPEGRRVFIVGWILTGNGWSPIQQPAELPDGVVVRLASAP